MTVQLIPRRSVSFTVYGKAQPAGSKRAFVNPKTGKAIVTDAAKGSRAWKQEVASVAGGEARDLFDGPIELTVTFYVARPKGHYGTGKNSGVVKPSAPSRPATRPDATKLVRAVEDALTRILWRDDAQVVDQHVHKFFGVPERCVVCVQEAGGDPVDEQRGSLENTSEAQTDPGHSDTFMGSWERDSGHGAHWGRF